MKWFVLVILHKLILGTFIRLIVGVKIRGKENLRKVPQYVIVANHNSHLDSVSCLISAPVMKIHKLHPVAAADHFGKSKFKSWATRFFINGILIPRKRAEKPGDPDPMQIMDSFLKKGHSLIVFPEGTRGEPEKLSEFKKGVAYLLKENPTVPFVPAFMKGLGKNLPKGKRIILPLDSNVIFGEPQCIKGTDIQDIIDQIQVEVVALSKSYGTP
jgi:1-acyl-sn-glycerol-3-phosphate acyltransferase